MYFLELHPRLYHMTSDGAWPPIQRHGLLSTAAILDRAGNERLGLEQQRRLDNVSVSVDGDAFVGVHSSRIFRFESCPISPPRQLEIYPISSLPPHRVCNRIACQPCYLAA